MEAGWYRGNQTSRPLPIFRSCACEKCAGVGVFCFTTNRIERRGSDGNYSVTYGDIVKAKERLNGFVHRTPLQLSSTFSQMAGCAVYMKMENMQKTGAFKIRGAFNKTALLSREERSRGIVTASAGNHAQGVASAAAKYGVSATVVMPESAPESKIRATEGYGAKVVLHGRNYDEAYTMAMSIADRQGATFIHAFDDPDVIAGQGTIGLEILEDLPSVGAIVVPVGGGGLIGGIAVAAKSVNPAVRIIGVQPEGAESAYLSWKFGELRSIDNPVSIADGLLVKKPGTLPFALMKRHVDEFVTVSDTDIKRAMRLLLERCKMLVEGAGAASLAALLSGRLSLQGSSVALVISGGNVDLANLTKCWEDSPILYR